MACADFLDGVPIVAAMFTLNVLHPGRLVYNKDRIEPAQYSEMALKSMSHTSSRTELTAVGQV